MKQIYPNDYFKVKYTDLTNWYNTSIKSLSKEYDIWKETRKQLEITNSTSESNNNQLKVKLRHLSNCINLFNH